MPKHVSNPNKPQARDDFAIVSEDGFVYVDVLANDGKAAALRIWSLDQKDPTNPSDFAELPSGSTVGIGTNGQPLYKTVGNFDYLAEGETATDSFTYSVRLGNGEISTATVNVLVTGVDDPTRIESATVKLTEGDDAADISTSGRLVVTDPDSPATVVPYSRQGQYGTFTLESDGSWTYEADGPHDEFTDGKTYSEIFRVNSTDGTGKGTVIIQIMGTADEPAILNALAGPDLAAFV
jgi:VCBS repeat-containing protein